MSKVYCEDCKYYKEPFAFMGLQFSTCRYPVKEVVEYNWYAEGKKKKIIRNRAEVRCCWKNKDNNCKDYEQFKSLWQKIRDWMREMAIKRGDK